MRLHFVLLPLAAACGSSGGGDDVVTPFCGDGIIDSSFGEQCDDGNSVAGDGCTACTLDSAELARISASWDIRSLASGTSITCPPGFDTAALYALPVDSLGVPQGSAIVDLFNCSSYAGTSDELPPRLYQVWIEITNRAGTEVWAESTSAFVDVTFEDQTFSTQLLADGGYFQLDWLLVGALSQLELTCASAPGGVEVIGTDIASPSNASSDIFRCEERFGITAGYLAAVYTISVSALDIYDQAVGVAPPLTNRVIYERNQVTDLGTVTIPIDGQ